MDWNSPLGIVRRAMQLERDGYKFYTEAAARASGERGKNMFLGLAADEEKHLRLLMVQYKALESGQGWIDPAQALEQELDIDPANPNLPGEDYPEPAPVFSPSRIPSLESDIAALEFGMEAEKLSYELYTNLAKETSDAAAKQACEFLAQEENRHYEILQGSRGYLTDNQTWWDDEQLPFFSG